ncbi:ATPase involved in biogenesis of flagella-like protein [Haloterrigena turkmenica DSM 5511]|uniref:ATPase involved in biogenesis of flagella-like protein n=1 Tax=Haloterrigena turkmenica (strain ATCC 51198 / DSM 5511 / JCM 9101 / NCIMB 13204 / VKM B-1734 / 4k) TaxID=543526 RepID=D2RQ99_HALTV|nr:ATPase domain-containing protein [Haloterrigena turkmenica]ADB62276.1 ATPase involved in biogenesis of flagella-like protein [Haloterrigena turkmenica DSM 5511]
MTEYHSIGLTGRDRVNNAIGGGIPEGSVVLVEGEDGAGKSALSQRFSYGMATEDAYVTYISTELECWEFVQQMNSLSYDVVDLLLNEQLLFLHANVDTHDEGTKRQLLARFASAETLWKADVVYVDTLSALLRNDPNYEAVVDEGDEDHVIQRLVSFLRHVTMQDKTVVLTIDPTSVRDDALRPLRNVADVYFQIETNTVGQEIRRKILVRRFQNMRNPVDDSIGFNVQQGRGISIVSRTVA